MEPLVGFGRLSTHLQLQNGHFSELTKPNLELLRRAVFNSFGVRFGVHLSRVFVGQIFLVRRASPLVFPR